MKPSPMADSLIDHVQTCHACIGAKVARATNRCPRRRVLIKLTLKERHG